MMSQLGQRLQGDYNTNDQQRQWREPAAAIVARTTSEPLRDQQQGRSERHRARTIAHNEKEKKEGKREGETPCKTFDLK
ncbi:hypothetical protein Syun_003745 [Stephania yunnanensis]|uniref:Uncharacterized protein n=1 Tax=Stephania yunnanensis TaxID=152371 RepID=A0AAP0L364_9MAGN